MTVALLAVLAVALSGPVPALLGQLPRIRRAPRAAMTVWQAVALAAVLAALGAGLALATHTGVGGGAGGYAVAVLAITVTLVVLGRLLLTGHLVGTRLRAVRRRHRELIDLVAVRERDVARGVLVLDEDAPVAYCLPGVTHRRVVISRGAAEALGPEELRAVLAHERAHLTARHDLVLEAFTVLNNAFPRFVSSGRALAEVRLLVEVLADGAAKRRHGALPLARSLVALTGSHPPGAALAAGAAPADLRARLDVLLDDEPHRLLSTLLYTAAAAVVGLPTVFVSYPWLASLV